MFRNYFISTSQILSERHRVLTRGILLFGIFSITLAGLIFLFPAFIGLLFATFILLAGLITLISGFRLWKWRHRDNSDARTYDSEFGPDNIRYRSPHYRFQTIRIMRW